MVTKSNRLFSSSAIAMAAVLTMLGNSAPAQADDGLPTPCGVEAVYLGPVTGDAEKAAPVHAAGRGMPQYLLIRTLPLETHPESFAVPLDEAGTLSVTAVSSLPSAPKVYRREDREPVVRLSELD